MHAEAPAALSDADQGVEEVGKLVRQCCELVDHDHQPRDRLHGGVAAEASVVVDQVRRPELAQLLLAPAQLGAQAAQRPGAELVIEVGHHADRVRQQGAGVERGTALVVDQHEVETSGAVPSREAGDQGAQQLALARTGGACDQGVRAVGHQVDGDHAVADPERCGQGPTGVVLPPLLLDHPRGEGRARCAQHAGERHVAGHGIAGGLGRFRIDQRRQAPGDERRRLSAHTDDVDRQEGLRCRRIGCPPGATPRCHLDDGGADRRDTGGIGCQHPQR